MRSTALLLAAALAVQPLSAAVRLPGVLSDHAVFQRDQPVRIWGWAEPSEMVTMRFHDQRATIQADQFGYWELWLKPERAGGPYSLSITGSSTPTPVERKDILIGDVWIASGQSNMEFPLKGFAGAPLKDSDAEITAANYPNIRLLLQRSRTSASVLADTDDSWTQCTP